MSLTLFWCFNAVVYGIAYTVHDWVKQVVYNSLVKFCVFTFYYKVNLAAKIAAQVTHNAREAVEYGTNRNHADFHYAFLEFARNAAQVLRS